MSHTVTFTLVLSSTMMSNSFMGTSFLLMSLLLLDDSSLNVTCAIIFLRLSLCRKKITAIKFNRGKMINTKAIVITSGETKSSNNGRAVTKN